MNNTSKWLAAIAAAFVAFFAVWGYDVVVTPPDEEPPDTVIEPPDTTALFTLAAVAFPDSVVLSWQNPPDSATGFRVWRSPSGAAGTFDPASGELPAEARAYTDVAVAGGQTWHYSLATLGVPDSLDNAGDVVVTIPADSTAPPDTTEPPDTLPGEAGGPGEWPDHEPAGMTELVDWRGDRLPDEIPMVRRIWGDSAEFARRYVIVDDPNSRYGTALEKRYFQGDGDGWGDVGDRNNRGPRYMYGNQDHYDEVYMRVSYMFDPAWENHPSGGDKMVLSLANGIHPKAYHHGRVPYWPVSFPKFPHGNANQGGYAWLPVVPGSPPLTGGSPVSELRQLGYLPSITFGQYHTVEVWLKRSDPGQINASMRFWFDGVEYTRFLGLGHCDEPSGCDVSFEQFRVDYPDAGESDVLTPQIEFPMYWGGQNGLKDEDEFLRLSEVYVSGRN